MSGLDDTLRLYNADRERRDAQTNLGLSEAVRVEPEQAARTRDLARRYGMPETVVEEFREDYEARAKADDAKAAVYRSATVQRWLDLESRRGMIAHDDLGSLTEIANTIRQGYNPPPDTGGFLSNLGGAARSGLMSGAGGIYGIGRAVAEAASVLDVALPGDPFSATAEFFAEQSRRFQRQAAADMPRGDGPIERGLYSGIASTVRTAPGLLAGFLPGGQGVALGMMTAPVGGESFQEAREQGLSVPRAAAYGITQAGIEYVTEKVPVSRLFGDLAAGSGFFKTLGRQLAAEVPGEQAATILQDLSEWATLNPDRPFMDYVRERPEAAIETLVATIVGTSIQTGTLSAVDQVVARYQDRSQRATLTEQQSALLQRMTEIAQASKVAERDPESFEALVDLAAEDGPVEHVYISAEAFFQSGLDQVAGLSETVLTQLPAASASGGLVQIPVAEWTTRIARTEQGAAALDSVKFDPEGFTRSEAVAYLETEGEQLAADVAQAMAVEQDNESFQESRNRVRDVVLEELNTAGRFRAEKNAVDAELIAARTATRAAQLGMMPEELWQQQGFRVRAELPTDAGVRLDQPAWHGSPHLFDEFRLSAMGTGEGAQAYGWGLYFAENKGIAEYYRNKLQDASSDLKPPPPGSVAAKLIDLYQFGDTWAVETDLAREVFGEIVDTVASDVDGVNFEDLVAALATPQSSFGPRYEFPDGTVALVVSAAGGDFWDAGVQDAPKSALYEVEIPDEAVARFLDWDAPLSEQPEAVREALDPILENLRKLGPTVAERIDSGDVAGGGLYQMLSYSGGAESASKKLQGAGIPGIKYLDAGSRDAGEGTRNLVVFDESLITIKTRNGEPIGKVLEQSATDEWAYQPISPLAHQTGHRPPDHSNGAPIYDLTKDIYPEDVYSASGIDYYGTGDRQLDQEAFALFRKVRNKPDASITIYRAAPSNGPQSEAARRLQRQVKDFEKVLQTGSIPNQYRWNRKAWEGFDTPSLWYENAKLRLVEFSERGETVDEISPGDWVTPTKAYARLHGESALGGNYRIISKKVRARDLFTEGNSPHEFGYDPAFRVGKAFEQAAPVGPRGAYIPDANTIALLENANLSTFLHESAHYFFESDIALAADLIARGGELTAGEQQIIDDVSALLKWHGIQGTPREQLDQWATASFEERRAYHERTAESFERYLFEGNAPSVELASVFFKFREWLKRTYENLKRLLEQRPDAGALSDEVRGVFDRMLATEEQIAVAEQARSLMPLFATADQAGMDPEAFQRYHEVAQDATQAAERELESKGLRDMRWLHRARGREVSRLKREAKAARGEVEMEVRREVMAQPVYRAWRFLTARVTEEDALPTARGPASSADVDPAVDSMFAAIAKLGGLNKDKTVSEFGVDPKAGPQSGVFGKPVWRLGNEGHSPDAMAHMLAEYGYLYEGEDGRPGLHELESRFDRELSGDVQRSLSYDYARDLDVVPGSQMHNRETIAAGRLDIDALSDMDVPDGAIETLRKRRMTKRNAIHPDIVAELTGFSSGEEMVAALASADDPRTVIADTVDQRMIEQYGELATPEAIERAADAAVHNAARARMVETELGALDRAMNARQPAGRDRRGRRRSVNVLPAAAREMARNMIARLRVRDVRPSQYAAAQARAAEAAGRAMGAGNLAEAAAEKRNQLLNLYAARAAYDAQDEVAKGVAYLKKFAREGTRKNLARDYLDQIDALLEQFDLRSRSLKSIDRDTSLAEWVKSQQDQGFEPTIDAARLAQIGQTHYRNLTVEDFRGLVEAVQNIEHLGRLKQKLLKAKDQRELDVILNEVSQSIRDNGGKAKPIPIDEQAEKAPWLQGFLAGHRKFSSLIRQMDGGQDGGPFWRALGRSMNDAGTLEASLVEGATQDLVELYAPILRMKGGTTGAKMVIPEIGETLTRGARLAVALNWGNEQNRQRLMDGRGWTPQQVEVVLEKLSPVEWDFVQGVWDYLETWWPQIEAKEIRVAGKAPEKVPALPFEVTMPNGQTRALRGGYYPAKYDARQDIKTEQQATEQLATEIKRGAYTRSTTRRGHTKQRAENVSRPIRLSLDVITEHVAQVAHDLAWHEWLIDAGRILGSQRVQSAIRDHYGPAVARTMRGHLDAIAVGELQAQTAIDRMLLYLRASVSRSTMGISFTTALLQPFGLTQSMVRIGPQWVLRGLARWAGDTAQGVAQRGRFLEATQSIYDRSEFMRLRARTFNRELHEIRGRVTKGHSRARQTFDATMFMLMQKMQLVADVPTWLGAYEKATAAGLDEEAAIAQADQAVLDSQGGGQTKDLAEFQKRHPMLTMFYSYFSTTYNLAAESTARVSLREPLTIAGWVSDMMLLMVIPAIAPALLLYALQGGADDEKDLEEWAALLAKWQASYLLGLLLGAREFSGAVAGFDYTGPPVGRVVTELARLGKQAGQGELDQALAFSAVRFFGAATGIPTTQAIRSYKGWQAWEEGDAPAGSILFGPPPKD